MEKYKQLFKNLSRVSTVSGLSLVRITFSFLICRIFHGASIGEFINLEMYRYTNAERKKIYTFKRQKKVSDFLNKGATEQVELDIIMKKNLFNSKFSQYIKRDWYDATLSDKNEFEKFIENNQVFLIKRILSCQGKGTILQESAKINADELYEKYAGKKYIMEGFIHQHPALSALNSSTVNTVRIVTARLGDDICVLGACFSCGGEDTVVDNFNNGGTLYPLDAELGIVVGQGVIDHTLLERKHSISNRVIYGFQIPNWDRIIAMIYSAAKVMEHIGYVGWDIAVLEDGCEIIEANVNYPSTEMIQAGKFWVREKMQNFLSKHNIKL